MARWRTSRSPTWRDGDSILIRPGEQIPADGEIIEGASSINEAFLTGESRPVPKRTGDEAVAGAVNGEGALTVRVTRTGDATTLSQIMRLVEEAQASRSRFQVLADRAAFWLTIVAVGVSSAHPDWLAGLRHRRRHLCRLAGGHGARDRLPSRSGARHPAGQHERHLAVGPQRDPGAQPGSLRTGPQHPIRRFRQDRHPHRGTVRRIGRSRRRIRRGRDAGGGRRPRTILGASPGCRHCRGCRKSTAPDPRREPR